MPLYRIPLWKRFTCITTPPSITDKVKCLHIDQVGLFVSYKDKKDLTPEFIRRHLIGRGEAHCVIEADTIEKAIEILFEKYEGMNIGGEHEESKAMWVNKREQILELPFCELMYKNIENRFICGELEGENGNGEFGMCVLEEYDSPEECPIADFYGAFHELQESERLAATRIVMGYPFVSHKSVVGVR